MQYPHSDYLFSHTSHSKDYTGNERSRTTHEKLKKPFTDVTKPSKDVSKPSVSAKRSSTDAKKPLKDVSKPVTVTKPLVDLAKPSTDIAKPLTYNNQSTKLKDVDNEIHISRGSQLNVSSNVGENQSDCQLSLITITPEEKLDQSEKKPTVETHKQQPATTKSDTVNISDDEGESSSEKSQSETRSRTLCELLTPKHMDDQESGELQALRALTQSIGQ